MGKRWIALVCALLVMVSSVALAEGDQPPAPPTGGMGAPPDGAGGGMGAPPNGMGGGSQTVSQGSAATIIDADTSVTGMHYASQNTDENALRVTDGVTALLTGITVDKVGGTDNADSCNFYGQNASLLATDGASVTITGAAVTTDGSGANGVFAYGSGTVVTITGSTIATVQDNSGGILVTGGGTLIAQDLTVETQGNSSAAIRSDRGGGTMSVTGGTYGSHGTGSPAIYSTAAISVSGATLAATASEAVVVEGKNSVALTDCDVTGNMQGTYGQNSGENVQNVMLYQSMSGDADVGRSDFAMTGGSLTALAGDMFYVTNTACSIELSGVALTLANGTLLHVAGNDGSRGWGVQGENGGDCVFTADGQALSGQITVDGISVLVLTLQNGSSFTGAINVAGQAGEVNVTLDGTSTWTLTGDSYITSFAGDSTQVNLNGYTLNIAQV